jgi:hypothetical protein
VTPNENPAREKANVMMEHPESMNSNWDLYIWAPYSVDVANWHNLTGVGKNFLRRAAIYVFALKWAECTLLLCIASYVNVYRIHF